MSNSHTRSITNTHSFDRLLSMFSILSMHNWLILILLIFISSKLVGRLFDT